MTTVFVARWSNTWGEYHGTIGVFTTREAAQQALAEHNPRDEPQIQEFVLDQYKEEED